MVSMFNVFVGEMGVGFGMSIRFRGGIYRSFVVGFFLTRLVEYRHQYR